MKFRFYILLVCQSFHPFSMFSTPALFLGVLVPISNGHLVGRVDIPAGYLSSTTKDRGPQYNHPLSIPAYPCTISWDGGVVVSLLFLNLLFLCHVSVEPG